MPHKRPRAQLPILAGCLRRFESANGAREVAHLLRKAVVPKLFKDGIAPTGSRRRFFDGIAETIFAVGRQRVTHVQVGDSQAAFAIDFDAIVHSAPARPAVLNNAECIPIKLDNRDRFVVGLRLIAVHIGTEMRIYAGDLRPSEKPVGESDAMAAEIEQRPAAGAFHIPKPLRVRPEVFLALLNEVRFSEGSVVGHLFGLKVFRSEEKLFGVKQRHRHWPDRLQSWRQLHQG